jgi:hypothetical protein
VPTPNPANLTTAQTNPPPPQTHVATNIDLSDLVDAVFVEASKQNR